MLLVNGIQNTIRISLAAACLGVIIGFLLAVCSLSKNKFLNGIHRVYTDIIRGTPSVTQLMIIYFVVFATVNWPKWLIASIAFGINSGAYVSEIIRGGILSVDIGQTEAGRSLGLNGRQTMFEIVVPQALKNIFPSLGNEFITLIKETAIVGYIGLVDIQKAGDFIKSATYEAFMPLQQVISRYKRAPMRQYTPHTIGDIDTLKELAKVENIVAIKEASGNISYMARVAAEVPELYIYSGNDDMIVPTLSLGGKGVISVLSNVMPKEAHDICEYYFNGEVDKSRDLQLRLLELINNLFIEVNPVPVKTALNLMGFNAGNLRMPLVPMAEANLEKLKKSMTDAGIKLA